MKLSKLASAALICVFFFSSINRADELTLDKLAAQFSKINKPDKASSAFEHWKYNTFAQTILFCWGIEKSKKKMPAVLSKYSPTAAGSFSLPALKDTGKFCKSLAEKPLVPFCTAGIFWAKDVKRRNDLPLDYVQVSKKKELKVEGSLKCFLNKDQMNEQPYIGPLTAEWAVQAKSQSVNTPSGPKTLDVGTVMIKAPGVLNFNLQPFSEIRMAVVIE